MNANEMNGEKDPTMNVTVLGEPRFASPIRRTVSDSLRGPEQIVRDPRAPPAAELFFELAGPREKLFFDPKQTRAGIVTCGGLCLG
jgi:6-phosphofructokinase 1